MPKLTDTQLVVLSGASQRPGGHILPLSDCLRGGAARNVVDALIARDVVAEVTARRGDPVWREMNDREALTLVASDAVLAALGIESDSAPEAAVEAQDAPATQEAAEASKATSAPATASFRPRPALAPSRRS